MVEQNLKAAVSFEGWGSLSDTFFGDNNKGDGIFINPRSSLRMQVEKAEAACLSICFQSKSQNSQLYHASIKKVKAVPGNSNKMLSVGIKKTLDCSRIHSIVWKTWSSWSRGQA